MILNYILSAVVLGFIVAIPPGSVTVIACQRAIQHGFTNSLYFSLGSGISDIFYLFLVYFGIANIFTDNQQYKIILWAVCGFILLAIGLSSIVDILRNGNHNKNINVVNDSFPTTFISGILITLTNPMTVVGWIGIAGNFFLIWENKRSQVNIHYSITIFLIMVGVYLWFIPLIYIVSRLGRMMSNKIKTTLVIVSGSFLVLFGLSAFYYVYALLRYYF